MPKKVSPIISDNAVDFYYSQFDNLNAGVTYTLEAYRDLYRRTIHEMRGNFSEGELMLMVDICNGLILTPGLAGQHIIADVEDGCDLDRLDKKWEIEKETLVEKLAALPVFSLACLEVWACGFWRSKNSEGELGNYSGEDFKKWLGQLSADKPKNESEVEK